MKTFLWKEWRQQRWLVLVWCLVGILLPLCEVLTYNKLGWAVPVNIGGDIVIGFGVLFAIILAAATTGQEIHSKRLEFWQSRPVSPAELFITKYMLAGVLLFFSFLFILSIDFITQFQQGHFASSSWGALCMTWPLAMLLFGAAMLLTTIVRDAAKASLLAIWARLLIYFLPLLVRGLDWLNVFERIEHYGQHSFVSQAMNRWLGTIPTNDFISIFQHMGQHLAFLLFCMGGSTVFLVLTVKAIREDWRWRPGQKSIVWLIGLSAMFIFGVSMRQVGHNLTPVMVGGGKKVHQVSLPTTPSEGRRFNWTDSHFTNRWFMPYFSDDRLCIDNEICYRTYIMQRHPKNQSQRKTAINYFILDIFSFSEAVRGGTEPSTQVLFHCSDRISSDYTQSILGCVVRNGRAFVFYRPNNNDDHPDENPIRILIVDVSDPAQPKRILDEELVRPKIWQTCLATYGDYVYVNTGEKLLVVLLKPAGSYEIVKRISPEPVDEDYSDVYVVPAKGMQIVEDQLLCYNYQRVMIFDITDAANPRLMYRKKIGTPETDSIHAAVLKGDLMVLSTPKGIWVYRWRNDSNNPSSSEWVGIRRATPLERLADRQPKDLFFHEGWLVENAGSFGVLVYDVSDPSRPRRAYHGMTESYIQTMGVWREMLYAVSHGGGLTLFELPKAK